MQSRAVDEAWHGLILCTARYSAFCTTASGQFLHHHPDGGAPADVAALTDSVDEQLRRTVIAWSLVATPGEHCVLWDLDKHVGVDQPWGLDPPGSRRSRPPSQDSMWRPKTMSWPTATLLGPVST